MATFEANQHGSPPGDHRRVENREALLRLRRDPDRIRMRQKLPGRHSAGDQRNSSASPDRSRSPRDGRPPEFAIQRRPRLSVLSSGAGAPATGRFPGRTRQPASGAQRAPGRDPRRPDRCAMGKHRIRRGKLCLGRVTLRIQHRPASTASPQGSHPLSVRGRPPANRTVPGRRGGLSQTHERTWQQPLCGAGRA